MTRGLHVVLLLTVLATGCAAAQAAPARPVRSILVYAQPGLRTSPVTSGRIWRANVDGRGAKLVGPGEEPSVSPDGRWIAFGRGSKIQVVPTAGGKPRTVYTLDNPQRSIFSQPVWAPNSRAFAVDDGFSLVLVNHVRHPATRVLARTADFTFSPNSRRIAYEADGDLNVISTSGGKPHRLTDDRKSFAPVWGKPGIAFIRFTHDAGGAIWLSDGRPRHARQLTHTGADTWPAFFSADGRKLLAANPATHDGRLWAVDVATGNERPLTPWTGDLVPQGLSSDGKIVLAAVGCGGVPGSSGYVETIPFAGGTPHVIVRGPCRASWNAR